MSTATTAIFLRLTGIGEDIHLAPGLIGGLVCALISLTWRPR